MNQNPVNVNPVETPSATSALDSNPPTPSSNLDLRTSNFPAPSALNPDVRDHRGLSRLAGLSARQLEHINTWLDDAVPYRKIVELCRTEFQVDIPHMTIARYNKRSATRQLLDDSTDSQEAAAEISQYAATGDASFSATTLHLLEQQAFDLALAFHRDGDVEDLDNLKKLSDLIHKAKNTAIRERHAKVQETKCDLRREELALKREALSRNTPLNPPPSPNQSAPQSDQFGPYARNWDEVGERVRIGHGISKEEWARRLALHHRPAPSSSRGDEAQTSALPQNPNPDLPVPTSNLELRNSNFPSPSAANSFPLGVPPSGGLPTPNENCSTLNPQWNPSPSATTPSENNQTPIIHNQSAPSTPSHPPNTIDLPETLASEIPDRRDPPGPPNPLRP